MLQPLVAAMRGRVRSIARVPAKGAWIGLGFLAGIAFWHIVGFWTFMSRIIFEGPETAVIVLQQNAPAAVPPITSDIETGSLQRIEKLTSRSTPEPDCIALVRSHSAGTTHQEPCKRLARPLKHRQSLASRGDRTSGAIQHTTAPSDWASELTPLAEAELVLP